MHPFLFNIGPFPIPTYGLIALLAFLMCVLVMRNYAVREGLEPGKVVDAVVLTVFVGLVGARLLELVVSWRKILEDPAHIKTLLSSAGVFLGGLVSAILFGIWWSRRKGIAVAVFLDILGMVGAMSMAVARWGCFFSGCCYGKPTTLPWGISYPEIAHKLHEGIPYGPVHPAPIYLSLNSLIIFFILAWLYRRKRFNGQIILAYVLLYAVARYFIEYVRGDAARGFVFGGLLSTSQLISIIIFIAAAACYVVLARRSRLSA